MSDKKIHKRTKDQVKHNHREAVKGHRTRKHFIDEVHVKEAVEEIKEVKIPPCRGYDADQS